ncbi:MAG: glycoside hydrolase family 43 protein [Anaerolineaceae bacterium]|nr:glycoside hydrolase family 43 protein [Anaerolineaceae bacterium]
MHFNNPIIPGFHPDPSICRAGHDYYLVTSSFEYFPGVPVFHSRDLIHWSQVGYCLSRNSQLPLSGARSSGGIYAPTIRFHQGRFYMITTNVTGGGHFFVSADDPAGEWSEPVWLAGGGIDPSLFFAEDGKTYFTYTSGGIVQREIELSTGAVGEEKLLWKGTGGQYPEAPHLYQIGNLYYLLIAEGGTEYGHMLTIARSSSPWGPFEACPHNPILTHRSTNSPIQATGHGDFIQDVQGHWWVVFLGIRPNGHWPYHHLGRETFLAPLTWDVDGWPVIGQAGRVALEMEGPDLPSSNLAPVEPEPDSFDQNSLRLSWNFLRNPQGWRWSLTERPGWLRLYGSAAGLNEVSSPAWVGRRQEHFDLLTSAKVDFDPQSENEEAGLVVWMNERHHAEIILTLRGGQRCVVVRRRIGSLTAEVACHPANPGPVILSIRARRDSYAFSIIYESGAPHELARAETRYLSTEVGGGFTGVFLAMYSTGNGLSCTSPADFDWFEYRPE